MYKFYMDYMLLPVTPSSVTFEIANKNRTVDILNGGEVSVIKPAGLTRITFSAIIPSQGYHFANVEHSAEYYLTKIEMLKNMQAPFDFRILRESEGFLLPDQQFDVTLEEYKIIQDEDTLHDFRLENITLKQYRPHVTKTITVDSSGKATVSQSRVMNNRTINELTDGVYTVPFSGFSVSDIVNLLVGSKNTVKSDINAVLDANRGSIANALGIRMGDVKTSTIVPSGVKLTIPYDVLKKAGVS